MQSAPNTSQAPVVSEKSDMHSVTVTDLRAVRPSETEQMSKPSQGHFHVKSEVSYCNDRKTMCPKKYCGHVDETGLEPGKQSRCQHHQVMSPAG